MLALLQSLTETEEDSDKLTTLFLVYKQKMYYEALGILRSQQDAEDAVADAFLAIGRNLDKIDDVNSFATAAYLMITVKNMAVSMIRKRKREKLIDLENAEELPDPAFCAQMERLAETVDLKECLRRLDEDSRGVLMLHFVHGFNCAEIAQRLNLREGTVKKQLYRGKQKLSRMLGGETDVVKGGAK